MKSALVRVNATKDHRHAYVKAIGRDGGFTITYDKTKARKFTPELARELATDRLPRGITRMTFDTCPASEHAAS